MLGKKNSQKKYEDIEYSCTIRKLDDIDPFTRTFKKETTGKDLLDDVCDYLNLEEKDYFGLRYVDSEKQRHWLDPLKPVYKQLKHVNPLVLCFRVKFYPTDPTKLKEEVTRYYLFLQLRRDLHHGRLLCPAETANQLAAYIVQAEVGDYDERDHPPNYVSEFKMLPKQTSKQEEKIAEIHKNLAGNGMVPGEAENSFLKLAASLDTYGVDPHPVKWEVTKAKDNKKKFNQRMAFYRKADNAPIDKKPTKKPKEKDTKAEDPKTEVVIEGIEDGEDPQDQKGNQMYLGVTHLGIVTFQGNKRTHLFKWPQITKIAFEGKMFIVHVTISEGEENSLLVKRKKHACGFKCPTYAACKHLWKCAVEQQYFFTLNSSEDAPKVTSGGSIFTRGSKFRFSGRCQKEVYSESARITRMEPSFSRSISNPQLVRSFNRDRAGSLPSKLKDKDIGPEAGEAGDRMSKISENSVQIVVENPLYNVAKWKREEVPRQQSEEPVTTTTSEDADYPNSLIFVSTNIYTFADDEEKDTKENGSSDNIDAGIVPDMEPATEAQVTTDSIMEQVQYGMSHTLPRTGLPNGAIKEEFEDTLPHERAVEVGDDSYRPLSSPSREDLPPFPVNTDTPDASIIEKVDETQNEVEEEVEKEEGSTLQAEAAPVETEEPVNREEVEENGEIDNPANEIIQEEVPQTSSVVPQQQRANQRGLNCCKVLTLVFFFVFTTMLVMVFFVLESELDVPVINKIRQLPEVQDFKSQQYSPFKTTVTQKLNGLFNKR